MLASILLRNAALLVGFIITAASALNLNVTVVGSHENRSRFECWQMSLPFEQSSQPGVAGTSVSFLGEVSNITYNVIPAGFDGGLHVAPRNQWIVVLNGIGVITLPDNSTATITASAGGSAGQALLFAKDTATVSRKGHGSHFPGVEEAVFLQIPTRRDALPDHVVLFDNGPCQAPEFAGLRSLAVGS